MELSFPKFKNRTTFYSFIRYYYSHILTLIAFLLLMYVAFVFYYYDYAVVNATYAPATVEVTLRRDALEKLAQDIEKRQTVIPQLPDGIKNPFDTPEPSKTPAPTATPSPAKTPVKQP